MGIDYDTAMEAMVVVPLRSTAEVSVPRHLASSRAISPGTGRGSQPGAGALPAYSCCCLCLCGAQEEDNGEGWDSVSCHRKGLRLPFRTAGFSGPSHPVQSIIPFLLHKGIQYILLHSKLYVCFDNAP